MELAARRKNWYLCADVCVHRCLRPHSEALSLKDRPPTPPKTGIGTGFPKLGGYGISVEMSQAGKENSELTLKLVPYIKVIQLLGIISNVGNPQRKTKANHFFHYF